jgi:hypothetical protein
VPDVEWFPVATLLLGYVLRWLSDFLSHRHTRAWERQARQEAREDRLREQRTTFQRETLLNLQEAVMDMTRATAEAHVADMNAYRKTGEWRTAVVPALEEGIRLASARTTKLLVRVSDEAARGQVVKFKAAVERAVFSDDRESCQAALRDVFSLFDEVNDELGELLRKIDDVQVKGR